MTNKELREWATHRAEFSDWHEDELRGKAIIRILDEHDRMKAALVLYAAQPNQSANHGVAAFVLASLKDE